MLDCAAGIVVIVVEYATVFVVDIACVVDNGVAIVGAAPAIVGECATVPDFAGWVVKYYVVVVERGARCVVDIAVVYDTAPVCECVVVGECAVGYYLDVVEECAVVDECAVDVYV